jgi:hydrogenase maturation protease
MHAGESMTEPRRTDILILGIGNLLLSDEGVGPHAVRLLAGREIPPGVEVLDGGTSGADLVDHLEGRAKVIVIDAASGAGPPGTIYRCEARDLMEQGDALSLHEFGLVETLRMADQLGCAPGRVVVLGVQPATIAPGLDLSPAVAAALPRVLELALAEAAGA